MIKIVTDSTADLPADLVEEYGINVVPLNVHIDTNTYKDGIELSSQEFFEKLPKAENVPSTSQPSPGEFKEAYEEIAISNDSIISIHISKDLSGTYQSAIMAQSMIKDIDIEVIDSRFVSMGLGVIVLEAARAVKNGMDKQGVLNVIEKMMADTKVYFCVDTLEYLQKNGRIGKAQAFLGTVLSMKPVLAVENGIIVPVEKVRGKKKGLRKTIEYVEKAMKDYSSANIAVLHGNAEAEGKEVESQLKELLPISESRVIPIGAVVGVHTGPGVIGVAVYPSI